MSRISINYVLVGLVCLVIASVTSCSGVGSSDITVICLESEREALLEFKQALVDESNSLASWTSEKDCCKWRGIACNNLTGHVTTLDLSIAYDADFNELVLPLRGSLHHSLLALRHLNFLDLSYNDFGGMMIPEFIGSLSHLKQLKLVDANFSGYVPPHLGNLSNLHTLNISMNYNVHVENLEWLSHLSSLRYLSMSDLNLSKVVNWPRFLSKLTSLTELQLSSCNLPDVDLRSFSFINSSTSLQVLDLSRNSLNSSIFYWMANINNNLVDIQLSSNELQGHIPVDAFTNMHSLVSLDLSSNQLEGGIPNSFQSLCSLESLSLSSNRFSENMEGFSKTLACARNKLENIDLSFNEFWGSLPDFTGFSKLRGLALDGNNLNGSLPKSLGQLSSLEEISLSENFLSGVITETFFQNLSHLHHLGLYGNPFSINLSSDWIPPFQLTGYLDMSNHKIGPRFPKWILTQTKLTSLGLFNCGLSGSLPDEFLYMLPNLFYLDLSTNQLHGNLPNLSATISSYVNLSSNLFSGVVPSFSPNLGGLYLSNNKLSKLPSSFCVTPVSFLIGVDISNNLLSGVLPDCWMQFPRLAILKVQHNNLSGDLPRSLGDLKSLRALLLNDNNFSGELPSLENCTELLIVDLGSNNLSGKIPTWINPNLSKLVVLRLRSNEFSGIIPFSLCGLGLIHVLDLSYNNISGALPYCLSNVTTLANDGYGSFNMVVDVVWKGIEIEFGGNIRILRSIDISSNYLVGEIPDNIITMQNLISLNLSRNKLTGKLPERFGNLKKLESLDLSRNQISGRIPSSFSSLNFLSVLDLSYNKFSGRIPLSTQLQSFDASKFAENLGLCGPPLSPNCTGDEPSQPTKDGNNKEHYDDDDSLMSWGFTISLVLGFITGFWTVCGSLCLKRPWRHAYFRFLGNAQDWIYVKVNVYRQKI